MAKTLTQRIVFKSANTEILYDMFLDTKHHSAITVGSAKITANVGATFSVYDGYAKGKNLQLVKGKLIVQSWSAADWIDKEPDSTFILLFEQNGKDAIIAMTHANIPDAHAKGIKQGWSDFYWKPWKQYLTALK
ncbi:MAG: SRPBCC domain-containing protein [Bacteroidia bacterium]|nr:SRPBCC domain-containing protein [Bacteroidia bacterium]